MEIISLVVGIIGAIGSLAFLFSRTDRLLTEIRDVLREIRDLERTRDTFSPRTIDYPPPYGKKD